MNPFESAARRWPIGTPAVGLALSVGTSVALFGGPTTNGEALALVAAAGAMLNALVLLTPHSPSLQTRLTEVDRKAPCSASTQHFANDTPPRHCSPLASRSTEAEWSSAVHAAENEPSRQVEMETRGASRHLNVAGNTRTRKQRAAAQAWADPDSPSQKGAPWLDTQAQFGSLMEC